MLWLRQIFVTYVVLSLSTAAVARSQQLLPKRQFGIVLMPAEPGSPINGNDKSRPFVIRIAPAQTLPQPKRFYIQAAAHGDETNTTRFAEWLARRIINNLSPLSRLQAAFDIVPTVNTFGFANGKRTNANNVNLNRNFAVNWGISREYPGKKAFSEPETAAIERLFAATTYTAAVDIHGYTNWIVLPSAPSDLSPGVRFGALNRMSQYETLRDRVTRIVEKNSMAYEVKTAGGLGDGGAFEDWAFWSQNVPAFCLEMDSALAPEKGKEDHYTPFLKYETLLYEFFLNGDEQSKV